MAVNAGSVYVDLGARLDRREFDAYERELRKVQERAARREHFKVQLGADFDARAFNSYERELKRVERANDDAVRSSGKLHTAFGNIYGRGGALFAAAGGAYGLVTAIKSVTSAYAESQVSQAKMAAQLKALGISYEAHAKQIDAVIQRTSKLAGLDDEDLQDAFTAIVRSTGNVNEALKEMALVADLARAKHMDVAAAGQLVARVHAGNTRALKSLGLEFQATTTHVDALKAATKNYTPEQLAAAKAQDKAADSARAIGLLQDRLKGTAAAYGRTQQGAFDRVQVAWENLRETIGQKLAPTLTKAANALAAFLVQMQDGTGAGGQFVHQLEDGWTWLKRIGDRAKDVGVFIKDHASAVKAAAAAWVAFRVAVAAANTVGRGATALSVLTGGRVGSATAARVAGRTAAAGAATTAAERAGGAAAAGAGGAAVIGAIPTAAIAAGLVVLENVIKDAHHHTKDFDNALRTTTAAAKDLASHGNVAGLRTLSGSLDDLRKTAHFSSDEVNQLKAVVKSFTHDTTPSMKTVADTLDTVRGRFEQLKSRGGGSIKDLESVVQNNVHDIRVNLGSSKQGTDAMAGNFRDARSAVQSAMHDDQISVRDGLREIRRLMQQELVQLGITNLRGTGPQTPAAAEGARNQIISGNRRYGGGWIGMPGMVGPDTVPAMLAPGEAVLNRHQQAVIEGMLGDGFLDRLFATVQRPHYMDRGGRIPFAAGGLAPAVSRLANSLASKFGLTITSTTGGTHAPGSFHYQGLAADLGGSPQAMGAASSWLMSSGTYRSLLEGIHDPGLSVKNGQQVSPSFWGSVWPQHANHVHIALRALGAIAGGGGAGGAWTDIRAPRVGGTGLLHDIVQGTLTRTAGAANRRGRALAASLGGGDITGQGVAGVAQGAGADVVSAFRRAIASSGASPLERLALWEAGIVESGLRNLPFGDRDSLGALQERVSIYGRAHALDPFASASRFLHQAIALRPFRGSAGALAQAVQRSAFPGRYDQVAGQARQYMNLGGIVRRFNGGGRAGPFSLRRAPAAHRPRAFQPWGAQAPAGSDGTHLSIAALRSGIKDKGTAYDSLMAFVQDQGDLYTRVDARYNLTQEDFIDANGEIDFAAVKRKAAELQRLADIRVGIENALRQARVMAQQAVRSYRTIIGRLQRSLRHARGKDRKGVQARIDTYQARLDGSDGWIAKAKQLGGDIYSAHTDVLEIQGELADVYPGAQRAYNDAHPADTTASGGGDTSGGTIDTPTAPTVADIAAGVIQELATFNNQGRRDLLAQFGANAITPRQAYMPGGVFSGTPDELTAAAGMRYFGATGGSAGMLGGSTVIANFASAPDNAPTFVQQMRFLVENGSAG